MAFAVSHLLVCRSYKDDCSSRFAKLAAHLVTPQAKEHMLLGAEFNAENGRLGTMACALQREQTDNTLDQHDGCLLCLCSSISTLLYTGQAPGDETAALSFAMNGWGGGSNVDYKSYIIIYVSVSPSFMEYIQNCSINALRHESNCFTTGLSCVCALPHTMYYDALVAHCLYDISCWDSDARNEYCHVLQAPKCEIELHAARQAALSRDDCAAFQHLPGIIGFAGHDAGMSSQRGSCKVIGPLHKPFFDSGCREYKKGSELPLAARYYISCGQVAYRSF